MTGTAFLLVHAMLVGLVLPHLLRQARWTHRAPKLAVMAWQGLMASFCLTLLLMVHHIVTPDQHRPGAALGLLHLCGITDADSGLLGPFAVVLWPLGWYSLTLARAHRRRSKHASMLALVARPAPVSSAVLLDHDTPAVYCLPGRLRQVVLTRGAVEALSPQQLLAALAHEEAHLAGRHHLLTGAAEAFARAFPGLPLGRLARTETAVLLEMVADDHAARLHSPAALARALCKVAQARLPAGAFGAGGSAVLLRVRRLARPCRPPHPAAWLLATALAGALVVLPLVAACGTATG